MGAGVEPGVAAAEEFDVEVAAFEVGAVDAGDFQFAACGRFDVFGDGEEARIVHFAEEIKTHRRR